MNNTEIKKLYNVVKIVSAEELVSLSRTYHDNSDLIIVMMKRKQTKTNQPPQWFKEFEERLNKRLKKDHDLLIVTNKLLIKVIELNNLKTE